MAYSWIIKPHFVSQEEFSGLRCTIEETVYFSKDPMYDIVKVRTWNGKTTELYRRELEVVG